MKLLPIEPHKWETFRSRCISLFTKYGDKRITKSAIQWLIQMSPDELRMQGTTVLIAIEDQQLVGCIACSQYGIKHAIIAVSPAYRSQNIGGALLREIIQINGKFYATVAIDNVPSISLCFSNEMTAFHLFNGPTGKPTLWLGGGNWSKKDVNV